MSSSEFSEEPTIDCDLPKDVIIDILSRLPIHSLLSFKSVCKSWAGLISEPSFVTKLHNQATKCNDQLIVYHKSPSDRWLDFTMIARTNKKLNDPECPPNCDSWALSVGGSCNGLVCICLCGIGSVFVLWNPATREFRKLPKTPNRKWDPPKVTLSGFGFGFGFEPRTGDFKILRTFTNRENVDLVDVYSKIADAWKEVDTASLKYFSKYSRNPIVSGRIHWLGTGLGGNGKDAIVSLDFGTEEFGDMSLPDSDVYEGGYRWDLSVFEESLSALVFPNIDNMSASIDLWVMKKYGVAESWMKQFSIRIPSVISRPLWCFNDGELILKNNEHTLYSYNPWIKKLETLPYSKSAFVSSAHGYAESLVSVRAGV